MMLYAISLGGSIVAPPEGPDTDFIAAFAERITAWLAQHPEHRLIMVIGGGGPARIYQNAYKKFLETTAAALPSLQPGANLDTTLDWIGIAATRLNAQLVKSVFGPLCQDAVVTDPSADIAFSGRILVAAGWKPGFSTDFDAVWLAERFGSSMVLNLSNIAKVYTADPRKDPTAAPIDTISWPEYRAMVGSTWTPGANLPFDPIASEKAEKVGIKVVCASGKDLDNLFKILDGKAFIGTMIG